MEAGRIIRLKEQNTKSKDTDQVLFYFIGLENIEETEAENQGPGSLESTITILQPVLTLSLIHI